MTTVNRHRLLNVLLAALLALTASVAMSGGQPSDAVEGPVDVVYVASGRNFPDALVGGGLAVSMGAPMLTVEPRRIPDATATALTSLDPDRIIVLGGPGAAAQACITDEYIDLGQLRCQPSNCGARRGAISDVEFEGLDVVGKFFPKLLEPIFPSRRCYDTVT